MDFGLIRSNIFQLNNLRLLEVFLPKQPPPPGYKPVGSLSSKESRSILEVGLHSNSDEI